MIILFNFILVTYFSTNVFYYADIVSKLNIFYNNVYNNLQHYINIMCFFSDLYKYKRRMLKILLRPLLDFN